MKLSRPISTLNMCASTWNIPARAFGDLHTEERLPTFSELGSFGDKPETVKVHVSTAHHGDELLLRADELIVDDVSFQAG